MTTFKSDLAYPYQANLGTAAGRLFDSSYKWLFTEAASGQPAIMPDVDGLAPLVMQYGTEGSVTALGIFDTADNGNAKTNTCGLVENVFTSAWSVANADSARAYYIDCYYEPLTVNFQYLCHGGGIRVHWDKTTDNLSFRLEQMSSHRWLLDVPVSTLGLSNGGILRVFMQLDEARNPMIVINGIDYTSNIVVNGSPHTGRPYQFSSGEFYLGRTGSWNNYYGWSGHINEFLFTDNCAGSELTTIEAIALTSNESYQAWQTNDDVLDRYALNFDGVDDIVSVDPVKFALINNTLDGRRGFIAKSTGGTCVIDSAGVNTNNALRVGSNSTLWGVSIDLAALGIDIEIMHKYELRDTYDGTTKLRIITVDGVIISQTNPSTIALLPIDRIGGKSNASYAGMVQEYWNYDAVDPSNNRYWSFDRVSGQTVPDLINGAIATLVNMTDTNYQLALPTNIYSIGSGKDYTTASSFETATVNVDAHKIGLVYGDTGESGTISVVDHLGVLQLKAATGEKADFKGGGAKLGTAHIYGARCTFILKDLNVYSYSGSNGDATNNNIIDSCHIDNSGAANGVSYTDNPLIVKNTRISNCNRGAYSGLNTLKINVFFNDCVFVDNGDYNALRANFTNCVATGATKGDFLQVADLNCISGDSTATGGGSQANVDFTSAFVDSASNDYRINQAFADTHLVGKGWNSSDIVSWAYHAAVVGVPIDLISNAVVQLAYASTSDISTIAAAIHNTSSQNSEQEQLADNVGVDIIAQLFSNKSEQLQLASISGVEMLAQFVVQSVEQGHFTESTSVKVLAQLISQSAEQEQLASTGSVDSIAKLSSQSSEQLQLSSSASMALITEFLSVNSEQLSFSDNTSLDSINSLVNQNSEQLQLASTTDIEVLAKLLSQSVLQEQFSTSASIDLFIDTQSLSSEQMSEASSVDITTGGAFNSLDSEQTSFSSLTNALVHALFNSADTIQESEVATVTISRNSETKSLSVEQLQFALSSTLSEIQLTQSLNSEQLSLAKLTEIESGFRAISEKAEQLSFAGISSVLEVSKFTSLHAFQQSFCTENALFIVAMPDLDWGNIASMSLSPTFGSESLTEQSTEQASSTSLTTQFSTTKG